MLVQITLTLLFKLTIMSAGVIMISKKSPSTENSPALVTKGVQAFATTSINAVIWKRARKFSTSKNILL